MSSGLSHVFLAYRMRSCSTCSLLTMPVISMPLNIVRTLLTKHPAPPSRNKCPSRRHPLIHSKPMMLFWKCPMLHIPLVSLPKETDNRSIGGMLVSNRFRYRLIRLHSMVSVPLHRQASPTLVFSGSSTVTGMIGIWCFRVYLRNLWTMPDAPILFK
jgi:hypothetical protein